MKLNIINVLLALTIFSICLYLITCTQTKTTSKTSTNSGIGLNSNYKMALGNLISKSHKKIESNNSMEEENANNSNNFESERLAANQVYFKGWLKYFKYCDKRSNSKPKEFFKNVLYQKDTKKRASTLPTEKNQEPIPSEKHFYGILFQDNLNIFSSNDKFSAQNVFDVLNIDYIKSIPEDKILSGGVKDFGKFSEGYCFQVNTIIPATVFTMKPGEPEPKSGINEVWLICTDDAKSKSALMNFIIKNRIKKQQDAGLRIKSKTSGVNQKLENPSTQNLLKTGNPLSIADLGKPIDKKSKDGKWIVLQDWTQCNLKCGGGEQTLHLICQPPENGGKPCQGAAIRKRPCNTQPCPILKPTPNVEKYEKPIVKVMPISNKPTRYDKCNLKENDVFIVMKPEGCNLETELSKSNFLNSEQAQKIPARIIMNNKSVSFYRDDSLQSILLTLSLDSTLFFRIPNNETCFFLQGKSGPQQIIVCSMEQKSSFVEEWHYDYSLFKNQCREKRPIIKLKNDQEIKGKFMEKIKQLKQDMIEEKTQKARQECQVEEEKIIKKKVDNTHAMTLLAIQKEMKLEQLLEKEEALREKEEEKLLEKQLQAEQKKKEILMKSIKEKELEEQFNISRENAELAIKKLKEEAKNQIMKKRNDIKNKIAQMRLKSERKKAAIKSKILSMRSETAQKLQQYSKKGDMNRCFIPNPDPKTLPATDPASNLIENKPYIEQLGAIEIYCSSVYSNNVSKFMECKNPQSYCFVCCEGEFGQMHLSDREKCYNQRCNGNK